MRHGAPRRRPRACATVITNLRSILPFLTEYAGTYTTLRQATRDDITNWLADRPYRAYDASALRSLFSTLKAERLIFANPMRGIKGGKMAIKIPASLTAAEVNSVALAALRDPALRVVVALSGPHAPPARQIRSMLVEHVDLPGRRLDPEGLNRPLDNYTAEVISEYLAYPRRRWPNSTNPHLLITRNTATTATAVGTFWMDRLVKELPVGVDRLRQDHIFEEALANGADPLHLAHVFSSVPRPASAAPAQ
ncbi:hypothetical protein [Streptomyces sp. NPDC057496]|uniref:hypothetical protein n=1 Tax=Streptomyces sp. NPDC057496 TaxID=3346149 RepID=UPI0036794140